MFLANVDNFQLSYPFSVSCDTRQILVEVEQEVNRQLQYFHSSITRESVLRLSYTAFDDNMSVRFEKSEDTDVYVADKYHTFVSLTLLNVRSTTIKVKGNRPNWNQDFML